MSSNDRYFTFSLLVFVVGFGTVTLSKGLIKIFLRRDYAREKYYNDPLGRAKKEVEVRKEFEKLEKHRAEQKEMRQRFTSAVKDGIIKTEINNEHFERHQRP